MFEMVSFRPNSYRYNLEDILHKKYYIILDQNCILTVPRYVQKIRQFFLFRMKFTVDVHAFGKPFMQEIQ